VIALITVRKSNHFSHEFTSGSGDDINQIFFEKHEILMFYANYKILILQTN